MQLTSDHSFLQLPQPELTIPLNTWILNGVINHITACGFTSRTVSDVPVLFYLILVRTLTGASVHHAIRRDGVERHDR